MKLQEKQRQEKNKATLVLGLLILGYATFIALLGLVDSTANMSIVIPRAIVSVLIFAAFIVSYFKFKGQRTFEILCMVCMFTSYGVTILTQRNIYMYALVYPIMLTVMLYMDKPGDIGTEFYADVLCTCILCGSLHYCENPGRTCSTEC